MSIAACPVPTPVVAPSADPGIIVLKFGGTSLGGARRVRRAAERVRLLRNAGHAVVVVVSAAGDTTDRILERVASVAGPDDGGAALWRERDRALATGEDLSAAVLAAALLTVGVRAVSLRGGEAGIVATGDHGAGSPTLLHGARLRAILASGVVPVIAGFQAEREDGETVTLGRGGSDLSAVFLAGELGAAECQIVTDVDGVYTADPRLDPSATRYQALSHSGLLALTSAGAVVVHAEAARRAAVSRIALRIFHHRAPFHRPDGTVVSTATGSYQ